MRRNVFILLVLALIAIALAAALITLQPAGQARVTRDGNNVTLQKGRIGLRTAFGGTSCFVPIEGRDLYFKETIVAESRAGDTVSVPRVSQSAFLMKARMISEMPIVAIAR